MARIRIGTCSWKYPSWEGLVYSAPKGINYLAEYAERYDTVEIDQWFWSLHGPGKISLPRLDTVQEYVESVSAEFRFTVKVPNSITLSHFYSKSKQLPLVANPDFLSTDLFHRFLDSLTAMHPLLGPLMLQFEYLNRDKMPSQRMFLDRLDTFLEGVPKEFDIGIESRNPNYLNPNYFSLLDTHNAHHVYLQGYYMPPVREIFAKASDLASNDSQPAPEAPARGSRVSVIRLHGPDRKGMEERSGGAWNRRIEEREDELQGVAEMTHSLIAQGVDVFLNVNNHYEGSAPLTIDRIREILGI
jgi:uncharacterized protein YecE (DUF72 family)